MSDAIATFFSAWQDADAASRLATITSAVTEDIKYDDPRTESTLTSIQALSDYVGEFSANAPGWSAKVIKSDSISGVTRVTVAFGGKGPDGNEMIQHGQYFVELTNVELTNVELTGEKVRRMVGFVGTGAP